MATTADKARELLRLHTDPDLLVVVNVWDVISARVVADTPGTKALATASHSIAASFGYPDGEHIPRALMIEAVGRIAAAVELPVTADLEAGYDFVIVDSGPVLLVSDSLLMARDADGVLLSVLLDVSRVSSVEETRDRLRTVGANVLGVVVNGVVTPSYRSAPVRGPVVVPGPLVGAGLPA